MQMLEIRNKLKGFFAILILGAFPIAVSSKELPDCDNSGQADLISCAATTYADSDSKLNEIYIAALASLGTVEKKGLRSVQRTWILFRDSQCGPLGNVEMYGQEAPIEELSCLASLTDDRITEIEMVLGAGVRFDYYTVINSLVRAGFDPGDTREKLANASSDNPRWSMYVDENCAFVAKVVERPILDCKARMNLFRTY
ncbi:lysozyme inhibitor LprI family protein [Luteimonas sp. A277]